MESMRLQPDSKLSNRSLNLIRATTASCLDNKTVLDNRVIIKTGILHQEVSRDEEEVNYSSFSQEISNQEDNIGNKTHHRWTIAL